MTPIVPAVGPDLDGYLHEMREKRAQFPLWYRVELEYWYQLCELAGCLPIGHKKTSVIEDSQDQCMRLYHWRLALEREARQS